MPSRVSGTAENAAPPSTREPPPKARGCRNSGWLRRSDTTALTSSRFLHCNIPLTAPTADRSNSNCTTTRRRGSDEPGRRWPGRSRTRVSRRTCKESRAREGSDPMPRCRRRQALRSRSDRSSGLECAPFSPVPASYHVPFPGVPPCPECSYDEGSLSGSAAHGERHPGAGRESVGACSPRFAAGRSFRFSHSIMASPNQTTAVTYQVEAERPLAQTSCTWLCMPTARPPSSRAVTASRNRRHRKVFQRRGRSRPMRNNVIAMGLTKRTIASVLSTAARVRMLGTPEPLGTPWRALWTTVRAHDTSPK